jgi:hypothetical protein
VEARRPRFGTTFFDANGLSVQFGAVQLGDCSFGFGFGGHSNERKSSGLAGEFVPYDVDCQDLAEGLKGLANVVLICLQRQISYIDIHLKFLLKILNI